MGHSQMLTARRQKKSAQKSLALQSKRAKKLAKQAAKPAAVAKPAP